MSCILLLILTVTTLFIDSDYRIIIIIIIIIIIGLIIGLRGKIIFAKCHKVVTSEALATVELGVKGQVEQKNFEPRFENCQGALRTVLGREFQAASAA